MAVNCGFRVASVNAAAAAAAAESQSDSKLKYIIVFGAPLVAGIALYWYLNRRSGAPTDSNTGSGGGAAIGPEGRGAAAAAAAGKKGPSSNSGGSGNNSSSSITASDPQQLKDVRARAIDDQINSTDPKKKAIGYKNKGNNLFRDKHYKEAAACYTEAIKVCPVTEADMLSTFYQNRAAAYENLELFENVIQDCTKAIEHNRKYAKAYYRRARAWEQQGELRKCLEDATCCSLIEQFTHEPALRLADKVLKLYGAQEAKMLMSNRKLTVPSTPFIRAYLNAFCEHPVLIDLHNRKNNRPLQTDQGTPSGYDLALQDMMEENWEEVITHCTEEINRDQNKEKVDKALILRAGLYFISGMVNDSTRDIERVFSRENVDVKVRVNAMIMRASIELQNEKAEESLRTFDKAIELDPNNPDTYLHKGQVCMLLDQTDLTEKSFAMAASLRPDFVSPNVQLAFTECRAGMRFRDLEKEKQGRKRFEDCLKKFPNSPEVLLLYAQFMLSIEKYDAAEKYLRELIKQDPQESAGLVHLGMVLLQSRQDIDGAIELMQKAIEIDPKCQIAYETLGTLFLQVGRLKDGLALLEKGIAMAQTETELAHLIGMKVTVEIQMLAAERFNVDLNTLQVPNVLAQ